MLEMALTTRRGSFHLQIECRFSSGWTVIFGPSGAGKSTMLRILAGLDRPQTGRILLDGQVLTDTARGIHIKAGRRATSLVAQQSALFPHLSVKANVAYGLSNLDRPKRHQRVNEMLELVGATSLIHRRPKDLSGGELQRVALARSLAPLPSLLLLDEPFAALDGAASDALLAKLQTWLIEHRIQTVMATHDATDAFATGADVALLHDGRVTDFGPASEVLEGERERLRLRLFGSPG
jgi:ABC-type sulfate/molybdate transport systems ATPase subunit